MKKILIISLCLIMIIPVIVNATMFSDVQAGHWAEKYIDYLVKSEVINGYPDGTFKPDNTLSKAEYLKLIMNAAFPSTDYNSIGSDFNHWAAGYLKLAEKFNLVEKGKINSGNIDAPISRLDVVKILSLIGKFNDRLSGEVYARLNTGEIVIMEEQYDIPNFSDIGNLTDEEKDLLAYAVGKGYINGYPDGTFKPDNNLSRAEASKIIYLYTNVE